VCVRTNDIETYNGGGESFFEECLLNSPDKEEKSLDDGELWMNLHEDSLLREFGISLDAQERYYFKD
jgi:hypothetical protein